MDGHDRDDRSGESQKKPKYFRARQHRPQEDSGAKKRARAIERLFRRNTELPANVRLDLERELASQKQLAEDKSYKKKRSAMISRYHMVRFFGKYHPFITSLQESDLGMPTNSSQSERKKASRLVNQLKKKLEQESDTDKADQIRRDLHIAEVDEAYTLYFPHLETYVGLYSNSAKSNADNDDDESKTPAAKAALAAERPPMWTVIEEAMEEGTEALEKLRDRRSPDGLEAKPSLKAKPSSKAKSDDSRPPVRPPARISQPASTAPVTKYQKQQQQSDRRSDNRSVPVENKNGKQPELNRRERRRLMRETAANAGKAAEEEDGDEDEEGGGFFEGL